MLNLEARDFSRVRLHKRTGKPVITNKNAAQLQNLVTDMIEDIGKSDDQIVIESDS